LKVSVNAQRSLAGIRRLEILFGSLIGIMVVTFGIEFFLSKPNYLAIGSGLAIPTGMTYFL